MAAAYASSSGFWVCRLRIRVTMTERLDQGLLDRRGLLHVLLRQLQCLPGRFRCRRRHERKIDVRSIRQRDSPMRHRALRIRFRCFRKRPNRCAVIEPMVKTEPLIEIASRRRRLGRDDA
jgi:hypothetical protein